MPRVCTVCAHPDRPAIDQALVNRRPFKRLAEQFTLGRMALLRHHDDHLPETLALAQKAADVAHADDLLGQVVALKARIMTVLDKAEKGKDWRGIAALHREARGYVDLLGELLHRIDRRPTMNLATAPEWLHTRAALLEALAPYPEARAAVAARLMALATP